MDSGVMSGQGVYTYRDGSVYEGQWLKGQQNGDGKLTYEDGTVYQGQFKDNTFHGKGAFADVNGTIFAGHFDHNVRCGEMSVMHADGQRELRRYDSEGQEVERKLLPRVLPSKDSKFSAMGRGRSWKVDSRICLPDVYNQAKVPQVPPLPAGVSLGEGKRGLPPVLSARG